MKARQPRVQTFSRPMLINLIARFSFAEYKQDYYILLLRDC